MESPIKRITVYINPNTFSLTELNIYPNNNSAVGGVMQLSSYDWKNFTILRVGRYNDANSAPKRNFTLTTDIKFEDPPSSDREYIVILGVFAFLAVSYSIITLVMERKRMRERRHRQAEIAMENIPRFPIPKFYNFELQMTYKTDSQSVPVSYEPLSMRDRIDLLATSYFVVLPGKDVYLNRGELPPFGFGTRIVRRVKSKKETVDNPMDKIIKSNKL
jgi:hypothetical protein